MAFLSLSQRDGKVKTNTSTGVVRKTTGFQPLSLSKNQDFTVPIRTQPIQQPVQQPLTQGQQIVQQAGDLVNKGKKLVADFIPKIPGLVKQAKDTTIDYAKSAKARPLETAAGFGGEVLSFGGNIAGLLQSGLMGEHNIYSKSTGKQMVIPERWDISKQAKAIKPAIQQAAKDLGGEQGEKAVAVGDFIGNFYTFGLKAELATTTIGSPITLPVVTKFLPKAIKFVPNINRAVGFLGVNQIFYDEENGSRVNQLKNDLVMFAMFETGGLVLKGLSKSTKSLISKTVSSVKGKPKVDFETIQPQVQAVKDAIKADTGKPVESLVVEQMATGKPPKSAIIEPNGTQKVTTKTKVQTVQKPQVPKGETPKVQASGQSQGKIESSVVQIVDTKTKSVEYKTIPKGQLKQFSNLIDSRKPIAGKPIDGKIYHITALSPDQMSLIGKDISRGNIGAKFTGEAKLSDIPRIGDKGKVAQPPLNDIEVKRVADNIFKHNTGISYIDAEAMARDVISNRPFNKAKSPTSQPVSVKPKIAPPSREATERVSTLGLRVEQTAIEKKLTKELSDLPTYQKMDMKDQARRASDFIKREPDQAVKVAMGEVNPPAGLQKESVFKAVEASVDSPEMARKLANSPLVTEASELGQRIKALDVRTSESPVESMRQIISNRAKIIEQRTGKTVDKAVKETIKEVKKRVKVPDKYDWNTFIKSIEC